MIFEFIFIKFNESAKGKKASWAYVRRSESPVKMNTGGRYTTIIIYKTNRSNLRLYKGPKPFTLQQRLLNLLYNRGYSKNLCWENRDN